MSLRAKFVLYLTLVHFVFAAAAIWLLRQEWVWLLVVEVFFALSLIAGIWLIRHLFIPLDLIRTGAELIEEEDFASKFVEVGQPEMDQLIRVFNRMNERLREERLQLQEQHYLLEKILAASPSGIITFDYDGRISLVNPSAERLLQALAAELIGKKPEGSAPELLHVLAGLEVGGAKVVRLQGQRRVRCQKSQFVDRGFPRSFVLIEELTEELRHSEKRGYEQVIRMMAHEVNNSTGAVSSLIRSCLNYRDQVREADREDFATALQVAAQRSERLSSFMRNFSEVVKLPLPRLQLVNLVELLREIERLLQVESQQRHIIWEWEVEDELPPLHMDREQMEQVFVNVLRNAMEAIGTEGRIEVRVGRVGGRSRVVIADSGCGIAPEIREQLFTPFFSTKEQGQGIGLTLVQEILDRHGFEFSLESRSGGPTDFAVYFKS
ncbi:MAG: PAS domain-containing protein [Candidatus Latescibacteria bacterium]|nr:PAS domain-containing protein [Candidatus Latescibacterota bacterium]